MPDYVAALDGSLRGLRVGIDRACLDRFPNVDPAAREAFAAATAALAEAGAKLVDVSLPLVEEVSVACTVVLFSEALAYHRRNLSARWLDYGKHTRTMIASGVLYGGADTVQAGRVIATCRAAVDEVFRSVDLIATPTVAAGAPPLEGLDLAAALTLPILTPMWNALGLPALSVPMGFTAARLPLGLQIIGPVFGEATVLRAGDAFQRRTDWHLRPSPIEQS